MTAAPPAVPPESSDFARQASREVLAIFDQASFGIALSVNRRIVRCNAALARMLRYEEDELVGKPGSFIYPSLDAYEALGARASGLLAAGSTYRGEHEFLRKDGTKALCMVSALAVDVERPEWGTLWLFDEITQERMQQEALRAALLRLEALMANAPLGIILTANRCITDANAQFARMFGYAEGSVLGRPAVELFPSPEAYAQLGVIAGPLLSQAQPVDLELQMRRQNGEVFWAHLIGYVVDPQETDKGTIWLISDRTQAYEQAKRLHAALSENQAIFDSAPLGIVVLKSRQVQRCNPQLEAMFGHEPGGMVGQSTREWYLSEDEFQWVGRHMYPMLAGPGGAAHERQLRRRDGSTFWARMTGRVLGGGQPVPDGASLWLLEDITERRQTEDALRSATALNQAVFDGASMAMIATDANGVIRLFNRAAEQMLGYDSAEFLGIRTPEPLHRFDEVAAYARELSVQLGRTVEPGFEVFVARVRLHGKDQREWTYVRKDGSTLPVELTATALRDDQGNITGFLGMAVDITERREAQRLLEQSQIELEAKVALRTAELAQSNELLQAEIAERASVERQMREMAHYDAITGLPNRNLLRDRLDQALAHARRKDELVAVMFLDLDRFKNINDTLGHQVGDALLAGVARRLASTLRTTDTLSRIGGDEFVVVLPEVSSEIQVSVVAEKMIAALTAPIEVRSHVMHISTSIGICLFPQDGANIDLLLRNADTAMYQAKAGGRNTFRFFTEHMNIEADQRFRLESALRSGVRGDELRLHFQPLVDARTSRVMGVEALARWYSPTHGYVPPGEFISVAEETDLIVEIDSWVLRSALDQAARWRADGVEDLMLAVNLSARQFRRRDLVEFVAGELHRTGHPPHLLELEITESSLMHNVTEVIFTLDRLVHLGVKLAIDDFGTGYSSLSYLKRFPVHKLKIDQSFVRDMERTDNDLAIVRMIIGLGRTLQLELLAEGVETAEQLHTLHELGCERFQGYLFGKPQEAHQIREILDQPLSAVFDEIHSQELGTPSSVVE